MPLGFLIGINGLGGSALQVSACGTRSNGDLGEGVVQRVRNGSGAIVAGIYHS